MVSSKWENPKIKLTWKCAINTSEKDFLENFFFKKKVKKWKAVVHKESHWDVIVRNIWVALCRSFNYKSLMFMYLMFLCLSWQCLLLTLKFSFILNMMKLMLYCKSTLPSSTKSLVEKKKPNLLFRVYIPYRQGKYGLINVVSNENEKKKNSKPFVYLWI